MRIFRFWVGCITLTLAIAASFPAAAQTTMLDAYAAYVASDDETALDIWRRLADEGDAEAAFMIAETRLNSPVGIADRALAREWYRIAAERGHVEAQFALGEQLMKDGEALWPAEESLPHFKQAARWFALAAEAGYAPARHQLGRLHLSGAGVPKDTDRVRELWTLAAAQGYRESYESLPLFGYEVPEETMDLWVKFDALIATGNQPGQNYFPRFLRPLAEKGHMEAQYRLGALHLIRPEQLDDADEAERWLRIALSQGVRPARFFLINLALRRAGRETAR